MRCVSNVYTGFRGLIEHFTEFGAFLIAVCAGGFAGWVYELRSNKPRFVLLWLSAFYAAIIFSPLLSFFSFNGAALAWVVYGWCSCAESIKAE